MNERIRELIQMADLCAAGLMASGASEEEIQNRSKVVLAGLIVNQCADIAQQHNKSPVAAPLAIGYVIREHFGVEE
jgi:hypothetical protein